jgi:serine protease Do
MIRRPGRILRKRHKGRWRVLVTRRNVRPLALLFLLFAYPAHASETAIADLFDSVNKSVVLIRTFEHTAISRNGIAFVPVADQGSGVLVSKSGDVLTAAHLVQVADVVRVRFAGGAEIGAKVITSDPAADLALLRLDRVPEDALVAKMGNSDAVRVGQRALVIGAPYGLSHTLTTGHISARHAPGSPGMPHNLAEFFQSDIAINRGNSGGPMFNMNGEVIGVVSYILSQSGGFEGVGFAVTSNSIEELLLANRPPWSGISVYNLDPSLAGIFNLPQEAGLLVQRVAQGSPGERLGLSPSYLPAKIGKYQLMVGGDIILKVNGTPVGSVEAYRKIRQHIAGLKNGQTVTVEILRQGQITTLSTVIQK